MEQLTSTTRKSPRAPSRSSAGADTVAPDNKLIFRRLPLPAMRLANLFVSGALLIIFTAGCDSAGTGAESLSAAVNKTQALTQRDDPAMADAQRRAAEEQMPDSDGDAMVEPSPEEQAPTGLAIDKAAGLVFVPDIGWMDVASFEKLYLNEPEKLPGSFNHQAVHALLQEHKQ